MTSAATYPGLPPKPWTYRQVDGAYVVIDAQNQDVLVIPFDDNFQRRLDGKGPIYRRA